MDNMTINNVANNEMKRFYVIAGDNGFGVFTTEAGILDAVRKLHRITVTELTDEQFALQYGVAAYCNRFIMRNYTRGIAPMLPINMPVDVLYIDEDYEQREGNRIKGPFFPGLLM